MTANPGSGERNELLTNGAGIEKEFKRRIKTQTVLPSAETAAMLFWALLASGQITCVKSTAGRASESHPPQCLLISSPDLVMFPKPETPQQQFPHHPRHDPSERASSL